MSVSELTEGQDDLQSRLANLVFQIIFDGEASSISSIRYDLCVMAGASHDLCHRLSQQALKLGQAFPAKESATRFFYASSQGRTMAALALNS